jgi:hypothetical protein
VEGGSANDYDYVSGDPVNGSDLNGLAPSCRRNRALCDRYRSLRGNIAQAVYFGFSAGDVSRLRALVGSGELPRNGLDWHTDSCSSLGKISNGLVLGGFGNACGKHDFGYRSAEAIFGRIAESDRKVVDNQLRRDLQRTCTSWRAVASGIGGCYADAEVTYRAVRLYGSAYYGT